MKKTQIGLYQYLIEFKTKEELNRYKDRYSNRYEIQDIFINNSQNNEHKYTIEVNVPRIVIK